MAGGSYITFVDGIGSAQLDNGMTAIAGGVGSRFTNWTSDSVPIGPTAISLGTGALSQFTFRTDYRAAFDLVDIPNANTTILDRLVAWLRGGGTVSVTVDDVGGPHTYATCCLADGGTAQKAMYNKQDITWKLSVTLVNVAGTPVPLSCIYSS